LTFHPGNVIFLAPLLMIKHDEIEQMVNIFDQEPTIYEKHYL